MLKLHFLLINIGLRALVSVTLWYDQSIYHRLELLSSITTYLCVRSSHACHLDKWK